MTQRIDGTPTGRRVFAVRVNNDTPEKLGAIALEHGLYYIGKGGEHAGASGQLMDAIAAGRIKLSQAPKGA
jgi:hypothetical protein